MYGFSLPKVNLLLTLSCLIGIAVSLYAYTVEIQLEKNEKYSPMCDINPYMSCSKAFKSEYGKGLGLLGKESILHKPNSLFGLMFYSMIACLAQSKSEFIGILSFLGIFLSNLLSMYFIYILYFILYDVCLVCVAIYIVNIVNLILIQLKLIIIRNIKRAEDAKNKKTL